jgi:hypothetical protein
MPRVSLKSAAGSRPTQGNRELPVTYNFTNAAVLFDDLTPEMMGNEIDTVQSIWVDNSQNPNDVTILLGQYQSLLVRQYRQGIYPVIFQGSLRVSLTTVQGNVNVNVIYSNTMKPFFETRP